MLPPWPADASSGLTIVVIRAGRVSSGFVAHSEPGHRGSLTLSSAAADTRVPAGWSAGTASEEHSSSGLRRPGRPVLRLARPALASRQPSRHPQPDRRAHWHRRSIVAGVAALGRTRPWPPTHVPA